MKKQIGAKNGLWQKIVAFGASSTALNIVVKLSIVLGILAVLLLSFSFIPSKKVTEQNVILDSFNKVSSSSKLKHNTLIMAEKGGYIQNPANTRKAFDAVIKSSSYTDIVELDIRTSKDGILVVFDDETINSAALKEGEEAVYIRDKTVEELKKYNLGNNFVSLENKKPYEGIYSYATQGLSMLTFQEFVERYVSSRSSVHYIVDIKETKEAGRNAVDKAVEILKAEAYDKFRTRVIFSSEDESVKNHVVNNYPDYMVCGNGSYVDSVVSLNTLGLRLFSNPNYELIQLEVNNPALLGIKFNTLNKQFIKKLEARNMAIIYTGISTEEQIRSIYENGGHIVGTGYPKLVDTTIQAIEKELKENA